VGFGVVSLTLLTTCQRFTRDVRKFITLPHQPAAIAAILLLVADNLRSGQRGLIRLQGSAPGGQSETQHRKSGVFQRGHHQCFRFLGDEVTTLESPRELQRGTNPRQERAEQRRCVTRSTRKTTNTYHSRRRAGLGVEVYCRPTPAYRRIRPLLSSAPTLTRDRTNRGLPPRRKWAIRRFQGVVRQNRARRQKSLPPPRGRRPRNTPAPKAVFANALKRSVSSHSKQGAPAFVKWRVMCGRLKFQRTFCHHKLCVDVE